MKIHEYQGKQIFKKYGVHVPLGVAAFTIDEAASAAKRIIAETGNDVVAVKAQIHAGGRGKAGGVKIVKGVDAARAAAASMLGTTLITPQTGPEGKKVMRLFVEQGLAIAREIYLALLVDRESRRVCVMASSEGGVEIESVAAMSPEKILKVFVDPAVGFMPYQGRGLAFALALTDKAVAELVKMAGALYTMFIQEDCSLVEINPLVVTKDNRVIALDAKVTFDESAAFRHGEWEGLQDASEENAAETEAKQSGLSYIELGGNIGCLVNGAGLAMSTMDIIKHFGGEPANFLDVGGGATKEQVTSAFKIILHSREVKGIFVNIFGGIMRCDVIAEGVVAASREVGLSVPAVVRLEGTNVEQGRKILADSGLAIAPVASMADGARRIVELVRKGAA